MNRTRNRHVYKRTGLRLDHITTVLSGTPADAAERAANEEGKYVVIDAEFKGEVTEVYVRLKAMVPA